MTWKSLSKRDRGVIIFDLHEDRIALHSIFAWADDILLIAPSLHALRFLIKKYVKIN
jgi:hypothetical protein